MPKIIEIEANEQGRSCALGCLVALLLVAALILVVFL